MAGSEADRRDVDEAGKTLGRLVVAGGDASRVVQLVDASLDQIAQEIGSAIDPDTFLAKLGIGITGRPPDLGPNFDPAATGARLVSTPCAGGAIARRRELSSCAAGRAIAVARGRA